MALPTTADETLAWEATQRTRAALVAIAAGLLLIAGTVITGLALSGTPETTVLDALRDAAGVPPADGGLHTGLAIFLHHRAFGLTVGQLFGAVGVLLSAVALTYLFVATRARKAGLGQWALIALVAGGVAACIGTITSQVAQDVSLANFAGSADHGTLAAHDALSPAAHTAGLILQSLGTIALAVGFITIALNAMRVGLLTRLMGVLGMFSGLLFVIQARQPILQGFWLIALGATISGRSPRLSGPAWTSGKAEAWASRQELLEARAAGQG